MNDKLYYSIDYSPAIGAFKLAMLFYKIPKEAIIEIYKIFLIFPLINDNNFLIYITKRKKTKDFYKILSDYLVEEKNEFWIDYNIKYDNCKRQCYESLYISILLEFIKIEENGLKKKREIWLPEDIINNNDGLIKLGTLLDNVSLNDLIELLKVGEVNGKN